MLTYLKSVLGNLLVFVGMMGGGRRPAACMSGQHEGGLMAGTQTGFVSALLGRIRRLGLLLGLGLVAPLLITSPALAGPPPNDDFAHARKLTAPLFAGDISSSVGATKEAGEPKHAGNAGGASVWYSWKAPKTRMVEAETCDTSTNFNTLLAVYTARGSVPPFSHLHRVASNDNFSRNCPAKQSRVRWRAIAGKTYYIAVDGFRGASGHYFLFLYPGEPVGRYTMYTSQNKRGSFRVTPNGRQIKRLRVGIRYRCRIGGRSRKFSGTIRQEPSDVIKLHNGNFRVSARARARGVRLSLKIVGLFIDGAFDGRLRVRLSGAAGTCDTGRVRWTA